MTNGQVVQCPFTNKLCMKERCAIYRGNCAFLTIAMALVALENKK